MQIKMVRNSVIKVFDETEIYKLFKRNNLDKQQVLDYNNICKIHKNDVIMLPKYNKKCYVVKPLDSIESIAKSLNVDTKQVFCATKGTIFIGKKIFI